MKPENSDYDGNIQDYSAWAVPVSCSAMLCIDGPPYLKRDREETGSLGIRARKQIVPFRASRKMSRKHFKKQKCLQAVALRKTNIREELFVSNGEKVVFYKLNNTHFL